MLDEKKNSVGSNLFLLKFLFRLEKKTFNFGSYLMTNSFNERNCALKENIVVRD
jgi:hypothetical protein